MSSDEPPPTLWSLPVVEFAKVGDLPMARRTLIFRDGEEVGAVPYLVTCGPDRRGEFQLFHCVEGWGILGFDVLDSVSAARARAERLYPGISERWVPSRFDEADVARFESEVWKGLKCSFCGRLPSETEKVFTGGGAAICNLCVENFAQHGRHDA